MKHHVYATIFAAAALATAPFAMAASPLSVTLTAPQKGESLVWTLANTSATDVYILRRETPLDGLANDQFSVVRKGHKSTYTGHIVEWPAAAATDFVRLAPGESMSANIDLADAYDMQDAGAYSVQYQGSLSYVMQSDEESAELKDVGTLTMQSAPVQVTSVGHADRRTTSEAESRQIQPLAALASPIVLGTCSASQRTSVLAAHTRARSLASNALGSLNATLGTGNRYTTWFGTPDVTRFGRIWATFSNVNWAFSSAPVVYDCFCALPWASSVAYVDANLPYTIHTCGAFYRLPTTAAVGSYSRAGVLVHEMSHFNILGGTRDYYYEWYPSLLAATLDPAGVSMNADNYKFFAENALLQW